MTGHSNLTEAAAEAVRIELRKVLSNYVGPEFVGVSCLARGADQIFAEMVLELGGRLEAVIPASDYDQIPDPKAHVRYSTLLGEASSVHRMPFAVSGPAAYFAASEELIRRSGLLLAIWDGSPPDGRGGTADAVAHARACGLEFIVIWPSGAQRS